MKELKLLLMLVTALVVGNGLVGCTTTQPSIQSGPDAEVSFDGLHKVDNSQVSLAWAAPSLDLSRYRNILPVNFGVEYRPVENSGTTMATRSRGGPYFIDSESREQFEALIEEIVLEELQKSNRFHVVNEPGPDTLIVAGRLIDVVSFVPQNTVTGRTATYLSSVGEATLVLELRDSESNAILARAVDRRAAETIARSFTRTNTVTTTVEVRRLITYWASQLRETLEGFAQ
jgi:hypothetical protein